MKRFPVGLVLIAICTLPSGVTAFTLTGSKWAQPSTTFYVDVPGFNAPFNDAVSRWNAATPYFQFSVMNSFWDPCSDPNVTPPRNGAKFDSTNCGTAWGSTTLAVTYTWSGNNTIIQAGIVFNSTKNWDAYSGPYQSGSFAGIQDFTRVTVHELGHALGLGHENTLPSIMAAVITTGSTIEIPQQDDKNAVQALYGPAPDIVPPIVTITSPTNGSTFSTGNGIITLSGTGSDNVGVTVVSWTNSRGGSGPCTFTGVTAIDWTCSSIPLLPGQNILTVAAVDAVANPGTDTLTVTFALPDIVPPTVTITSPTGASTFSTGNGTITLAGTGSDNVGVTVVSWTNSRGGSGPCTFTGATAIDWTCSNIPLLVGQNILTVAAVDSSANQGIDTLTTTFALPDTVPPTVTIASPTGASTFSTGNSTINLAGTGSDNVGVTVVSWTNSRGGSGPCTFTGATSIDWTCSGIPLLVGQNILTVAAVDAGANQGTDTLTVTFALPDTVPPTVTITSPTGASTFSTGNGAITLGGTGSDNVGVTVVSWTNSRGGSGPCTFTGTTAIDWTCSSIPLLVGQNILTVTAMDAGANQGTNPLTITLALILPVISAVNSTPGTTASATVLWVTDVPSDSQVEFGLTPAYGQNTVLNSALTTSHSVNLSGLSLDTTYHYRVKSQGTFTSLATSEDLTFTTFAISNLGGMSLATDGLGTTLTTGFGRIQAGAGSTTPSGVAIFGYKKQGILISETGVPDSPAISSGRIYAEVRSDGIVNTGLAFVNPNSASVRVSFDLRDNNGSIVKSGFKDLGPGEHLSRFLDEDPYFSGVPFQGTFSFNATSPVSVLAVRGFNNERTPSEFLISTLPVIDLSLGASSGLQVIPQFAAGSGSTTQIFLVNPTGLPQTGSFEFRDAAGALSVVNIDGVPGTGTNYTLHANGAAEFLITGDPASLASGSVHVLPAGGGPAPTPLVLFSYKPENITVSEASVPVTMGSAFRMYVELSPTSLIDSGIAIANATESPGTVTLSVTRLDGSPVVSTVLNFGGAGQVVGFLDSLIPSLAGQTLQGVLRITSDVTISVVGLRAHYNDRLPQRDFLMATTPPTLETALPNTADRFFPQILNGGNFTTQVILFSGTSGQIAAGDLTFFLTETGAPLNLDLR